MKKFLEDHHLHRIMPVFFPSPNMKVNLEMMMFERSRLNPQTMELVKSPLHCLFDLLLINAQAPIKAFWEYEKFVKDFLFSLRVFTQPILFLRNLIFRFNNAVENPDGSDCGYVSSSNLTFVLL